MDSILRKPSKKLISIFIVPGITLFCFSIIVPIVIALYYSFFDWPSITKPLWIGIDNYKELVRDNLFWFALFNNLKLAVYTLVGQVGIGYLLAFVLNSRIVKFSAFHRTVLFFPVLISTVVLSFLWMLVYSNDSGILNTLLDVVGLHKYATSWLSNPKIIVEVLAVPLIWQWFGFYMVIFMGALGTIPTDIYESAELDGAVGFKKAWYISVPMTYDTLKVSIILCLAGIMKMFDHILVMTDGGPGNSSIVLALYAYKTTFKNMQIGYGNTISIGIVVFSLIITVVTKKLLGGKRYE